MDDLLTKWKMLHDESATLEKKKQKIRQKIEKIMTEQGSGSYENTDFKVVQRVQNRASITQKNVPPDIWDKYATINRVQFISITPKKDKKIK